MASRNTVLEWTRRGVVALIMGIAIYLAVLAVLDGLAIWKAAMVLILILLLTVGEIANGRKIRKWKEDTQKIFRKLK